MGSHNKTFSQKNQVKFQLEIKQYFSHISVFVFVFFIQIKQRFQITFCGCHLSLLCLITCTLSPPSFSPETQNTFLFGKQMCIYMFQMKVNSRFISRLFRIFSFELIVIKLFASKQPSLVTCDNVLLAKLVTIFV